MKDSAPLVKASFIGKGLHDVAHIPELGRHLLTVLSSLEKFQKEIQDCKNRDEALGKIIQYIEGWDLFHSTAFYLVEDDFQFDLYRPSDPSLKKPLEAFIRSQIKTGRFAWALQQNREVLFDAPENLPGEQILFHGMSTRHTTLGMFVGCLKTKSSNMRSSYFRILSIMIDAVVYVYENQILNEELVQYNQQLEAVVDSRTKELQHANQHLHQSNAELKKVSEKKSEFLGIVAHDLKNPLSGIIGLADLAVEDVQRMNEQLGGSYSHVDEMLTQVSSSAMQMVHTLNELMDSEVIESGNMRLDLANLEFSELVAKVVAINKTQALAKDIRLHLSTQPEVFIFADALRMHEAIDNLISNAIKYSPLGRDIWVKVEASKDEPHKAVFSVKDEGPGLTEEDKKKIFGRFQKLSAQPTGGESSTGLGLSIVQNLVRLHHGDVHVESEHGQGATFRIELPMVDKKR